MEIIDNKVVLIRTQNPDKYSIIPRSKIVERFDGGGTVAVYYGLEETRVLRNMGVKKLRSPITARYEWPGRYKPMAHQIETASFATLHKRAFIFNEPGTAKTISVLWAADYLMRVKAIRRVLVVCPVSIMHSAWMGDITNSVIHRSAVVAHHSQAKRRKELVRGDYEIVITNYEGIAMLAEDIRKDGRFDLVVVDECFVAGTLVLTPTGALPIESLQQGDLVLTSEGAKRIKTCVRKTTKRLVRVETSDGQKIDCTPEHPFFTDVGWVTAANLAGRRLVSAHELPRVCTAIPDSESAVRMAPLAGYQHRADLLEILRTEAVSSTEPRPEFFSADAAGTTGAPYGNNSNPRTARTHVSGAQGDKTSPEDARGQWYGHDSVRENCVSFVAPGVGMELPRSVGEEAARLSYKLQARLRNPVPENRAGGRRRVSQQHTATTARPEERASAGGTWVARVSHIECTSDTPVYNLEVEGVPNYFVGRGSLVHNCNAYKNPRTQRWKALHSILTKDTWLWMMTGTPAAQSPEDAYGLAKLVCPQNVPAFFTGWRDKVMLKVSNFRWVPKKEARDLVFQALQPAIRFTKKQCLDLPPVMTETREVPMTPQQAKYYKQIKEQMLVMAAGATISAVNKGVLVNKLLQISAGAAYTDEQEVVVFDSSPRLRVVEEILEETTRKVIIFALHRSSMDTLAEHLTGKGYKVAQIHGDVAPRRRADIINAFQHSDTVEVLVMQPQATAHGITLVAADTVVFYGPIPSVELYLQCIARADRQGQTSDSVKVIHIQSSPTEARAFKAMTSHVEDHALLTALFDSEADDKGGLNMH